MKPERANHKILGNMEKTIGFLANLYYNKYV